MLWLFEALDSVYMSRAEQWWRLGNFGSLGWLPFDLFIPIRVDSYENATGSAQLYANRFRLISVPLIGWRGRGSRA